MLRKIVLQFHEDDIEEYIANVRGPEPDWRKALGQRGFSRSHRTSSLLNHCVGLAFN